MAKVIFGGGISAMSGRLGGIVYARNRGGAYVRTYVPTPIPGTVHQATAQLRWQGPAVTWAGRTEAERNAWRAYAKSHPVQDRMGQRMYLSGFNWWMKVSYLRNLTSGGSWGNFPPDDPVWASRLINVTTPGTFALTTTSARVYLGPGAQVGMTLACYVTPQLNSTTIFATNKFRLMPLVTLNGTDTLNGYFSLYSRITAYYSLANLTSGKRLYVRAGQYHDGLIGPLYQLTGIVA